MHNQTITRVKVPQFILFDAMKCRKLVVVKEKVDCRAKGPVSVESLGQSVLVYIFDTAIGFSKIAAFHMWRKVQSIDPKWCIVHFTIPFSSLLVKYGDTTGG